MRTATTAIVVAGVAASIAAGVGRGFDATAIVMLVLIVAAGALGIAVARKSRSGEIEPARCDKCGGLLSASAPYCKHCGAPT